MTAFNIFLVRNYYSNSLPEALYEAAQLDGASELGIFTKIVFPLSKPVVATIGLFTGLSYWNSWTNALYYVQDPKYFGIQNLLMRIMKTLNICEAEHQSWQRKDRQFRFRATPSEWHWHLSEFYQSLLFIRCFRNILSKVWLSAL